MPKRLSLVVLVGLVILCKQLTDCAPSRKTILDDPKCSEVKRLCNHVRDNDDILILECLHSLEVTALSSLNSGCQDVIWDHTTTVIEDNNVKNRLAPACKDDFEKLHCEVGNQPGAFLKCIVSNNADIGNSDCAGLIERLENVAFYDYKWTASFLQHCKKDVATLKCGRIDSDSLSQSHTIDCLHQHLSQLDSECKKEIFKLAEIQTDTTKFNNQLYMACGEDHIRYCRQYLPGTGRVFKCLMQHFHDKLTEKCYNHLLQHEKLVSQDYRVNKGFMKVCRDDIKKTHCRRQTSDDKAIRLAQVLLCLEGVVRNGSKVEPDCAVEMIEHRKLLMEDYRLSPEIVEGCMAEIPKYCNGLEVGGKTIHCLMQHARLSNKKRISDVCQRAIEDLVKETDVGEDWRVDPVLHEACHPVVQAVCHDIRGGNARVMSCLMDNIGADHMTEECEDALMQIQYFVARDFKLDPQLYKGCRDDASRLCHASKDWEETKDHQEPNTGPLVLPCLYSGQQTIEHLGEPKIQLDMGTAMLDSIIQQPRRYVYHLDKDMQLNPSCVEQIHRVMRQRAVSMDLQPEIEDVCIDDLSLFCFDKTAKGEEIMCLQKNLEDLQDKCKTAVSTFTEMESQNAGLNPIIMAHCRTAIDTHCHTESRNPNGNIMECLIAHKNTPDVKANNKCRISIEHFQIVSLKDLHFSYKFKMACKSYAMRYCREAKTKTAVVSCLSERVLDDTLNGLKSDIHKDCRQQLRAQLFQQRENIDFDPKLKEACKEDIKKYCKDVEHGSSQVLECLQSTSAKLSDTCQKEMFNVRKQELTDNSVDYALMTMCAGSIQQFCPHSEKEHVLDCLKNHKDEIGFNKKCRLVVMHRLIEQTSDYRLNPALQENCKFDIKKFCHATLINIKVDKELNGEIIKCLKGAFKQSKLSNKCEQQMASILHDQALDVRLNPLLKAVCKNEIETICKEEEEDDLGNVEECLKLALIHHKIPSPACQVEVASMIEESQVDIQVDPLLQRSCSLDLLKYCHTVPQGGGRHIKCLKSVLDDEKNQLLPECKDMLVKRFQMYSQAVAMAVRSPEDLQDLYFQVSTSPSRHYFIFVVLMTIGAFFAIGMFCGRASRRHILSKNK